jgi:hypothetical protein
MCLTWTGGALASPMVEQSLVPQQQPGVPHRLNSIERQELELARRRAEKAAEGKRANAAAARAKRRASRPRADDRAGNEAEGGEEASHEEEDDLEAKLAATRDEKEAKRLRRCSACCIWRCPEVVTGQVCIIDRNPCPRTGCCGTGYLRSRPGSGRSATSATLKRRPRSQSRWCGPRMQWQVPGYSSTKR